MYLDSSGASAANQNLSAFITVAVAAPPAVAAQWALVIRFTGLNSAHSLTAREIIGGVPEDRIGAEFGNTNPTFKIWFETPASASARTYQVKDASGLTTAGASWTWELYRLDADANGVAALAPASTALSSVVWTNLLAGYIANLNIGGNVASASSLTTLSNKIGLPAGASVSADIAANQSVLTDGTFGLAKLVRSATPANALVINNAGEVPASSVGGIVAASIQDIANIPGLYQLSLDYDNDSGVTLSAAERNSTADAILDRANGVETGWTLRRVLRLMSSVLLGKASNDGTTFRDLNDTKDRVAATVDSDGNRTAITTDAT
jgi:hypothetical protein